MKPDLLKEFIRQKLKYLRSSFVVRTTTEDKVKEFFKILEKRGIQPKEDEINDILASCETRKDFSAFISAIYKITHDSMKIKDEKIIDPVRCYFHHDKRDKQQEWYKKRFEEFCKDNLLNFPPKEDEWSILKEKVLERALKKIKV